MHEAGQWTVIKSFINTKPYPSWSQRWRVGRGVGVNGGRWGERRRPRQLPRPRVRPRTRRWRTQSGWCPPGGRAPAPSWYHRSESTWHTEHNNIILNGKHYLTVDAKTLSQLQKHYLRCSSIILDVQTLSYCTVQYIEEIILDVKKFS